MTTQRYQPDKTVDEQEVRNRRAFRLLFILGTIIFLASAAISFRNWSSAGFVYRDDLIESGAGIIAGLIIVGASFLAKRGFVTVAVAIVAVAFFAVDLYLITRLTGIGIPLTITVTVSLILIASQTLSPRYLTRGLITIFAIGVVILLIDLFWPTLRGGIASTDLQIIYVASFLIIFATSVVVIRQFPSFSLRSKLITVAISLVVITVFLTTITVNTITRRSLTAQLNEQFQLVGESGALAVVELLERQVEVVHILGLDSGLRALVNVQNGQYGDDDAENLERILERDDQWINDDSGGLQNFITNNTTALSLRKFQNAFPNHVEMFITDRNGGLVGATNVTSDYYQADEVWWQEAYNDGVGGTHVGEPEFDESSGTTAINLAVPMFDAAGEEIVGIVRSTYSIASLENLLVTTGNIGDTGHLDVLFKENRLYLEDGVVTLDPIEFDEDILNRLRRSSENIIASNDGVPSLLNLISLDTRGKVSIIDELDWALLISQSEQEAFATVRQQQQLSIVLALVAIGVGAALASYAARIIASPINRLTETAIIISEGNLNRRASVETQDEIGTLAIAFNRMTSQLRNFIGSLEEQVVDRTQALATSTEVSRRLSTIINMDELVSEVVAQVRNSFGYYHTQIYLYDETQTYLVMAGGTGRAGQKMLEDEHKLLEGQGLVGRAASANEAILIPDVAQDGTWLANPLLPDTKSEVAIPIALGQEVLGVLDVQHNIAGGLNDDSVRLLQAIASQVAAAIQNARQYEQTQNALFESDRLYGLAEQQAQRLVVLNEMSAAFNTAVTEEDILEIIGNNILKLMSGDRVSVALIGDNKDEADIVLLDGTVQANVDRVKMSLIDTSIGLAVSEDRLIRLPLSESDPRFMEGNRFVVKGYKSFLIAPLKAGGKILGTVNIGSKTENAYQENDMRFMEQVASTIAGNLEGQRLGEQARLLASIVENHPDFIGVGSLEGAAIYVNPSGLQMMNLPLDTDVTQLDASGFYSQEDATVLMESGIPTAMESGSWSTEAGLITASGDSVPVEETIGINYDANNNPTSFSITMRDIRGRKAAEETLRVSQTRNEAILQSIAIPMLISSVTTGQILYGNQHLSDLILAPLNELIGNQTPNFYNNPEDRETIIETIQTEGGVSNYELGLLRTNGEFFWGMMTAKLFDFDGEPAIITTLVDVTERIHAQEEIAKQASELATVAEVSTAVATNLDTQTLLNEVVDLTKSRFQLYHAHIYLLSENGSELRLAAGAGEAGRKMVAEGLRIGLKQRQSLVAQAARARRGVVVNDVRAEAGFLANPLLPDTRAELATPMIIGEQLLGVLDIQSDKVDDFSESDINIQMTLASQIAAALQNATQYQRAQDALDEVTRMQQMLVREGWESFMGDDTQAVQGYRYGQQKLQPIKRNGTNKMVVVAEEGDAPVDDTVVDLSETAVLSPLTIRGASIGTLGVRDPSGRPVSEDKRQLLESISTQVAEALERARLFQQTEIARAQTESALEETYRRTEEMSIINTFNQLASSELNLDGLAKTVGLELQKTFKSISAYIALYDEDNRLIHFPFFTHNGPVEMPSLSVDGERRGFTGQIIHSQQPLLLLDMNREAIIEQGGAISEAEEDRPADCYLGVPMILGNKTLGVLGLSTYKEVHEFTEDDQGLLMILANVVGVAIQNAQQFEETQRRAERERIVNEITQKIQSTTSVETALQAAIEALGGALKAQSSRINLQLDKSDKNESK